MDHLPRTISWRAFPTLIFSLFPYISRREFIILFLCSYLFWKGWLCDFNHNWNDWKLGLRKVENVHIPITSPLWMRKQYSFCILGYVKFVVNTILPYLLKSSGTWLKCSLLDFFFPSFYRNIFRHVAKLVTLLRWYALRGQEPYWSYVILLACSHERYSMWLLNDFLSLFLSLLPCFVDSCFFGYVCPMTWLKAGGGGSQTLMGVRITWNTRHKTTEAKACPPGGAVWSLLALRRRTHTSFWEPLF